MASTGLFALLTYAPGSTETSLNFFIYTFKNPYLGSVNDFSRRIVRVANSQSRSIG